MSPIAAPLLGVTLCAAAAWAGSSGLDAQADALVERLRDLPAPIPFCCGLSPAGGPPRIPESEITREEVYTRLAEMGAAGVEALARGYRDLDVQLRRNVALALLMLGNGTYLPGPRLDLRPAFPALIGALEDSDSDVRAWSAQAIGLLGADGAPAVPNLVDLLKTGDEAGRNSACLALRLIGPDAAAALPALRLALSDPSAYVRQFATAAIQAIEID